jgi:predicted RNase H-like HicB family nuclease
MFYCWEIETEPLPCCNLTPSEASNSINPVSNRSAVLNFKIEFDREADGRWIAEIPDLPGVMAYGSTKDEAEAAVEALALRVIADRIEIEKVGQKTISFASA